VPTTIRSNTPASYSSGFRVRAIAPGLSRILSPRPRPPAPMPRSWIYMMAILIACLIASMVIATIKLL
jgi:hypothetical protein